MKNLTTVVILLTFSSIAAGEVSTRVCLADANTPLELADPNVLTEPNVFVYRDIMVGTKLTIIVDSNIAEPWTWVGSLYIGGTNRDYGELSARDYNDITSDWEGSHYEAVGDGALVQDVQDVVNSGFELYSDPNAVAGDWFVLDYNATNIGICKVDFYDYDFSWDIPFYSLEFSHVHTRDFNQDTKVDFADLALLSLYWLQTGCTGPDWCTGTDLNTDGIVDRGDLILFTDYWLERTE
jgi:hypothetical protein